MTPNLDNAVFEKTGAASFAELYEKCYSKVYRTVLRRVRNTSDAEDFTQEAFLRALDKFDQFNPNKSSFKKWVYGIAKNAVLDYTRRRRTQNSFTSGAIHAANKSEEIPEKALSRVFTGGVEHALGQLRAGSNLVERMENEDMRRLLWQGIDNCVGEVQRLPFKLYLLGRPAKETSELLGVKIKTINTRIYHGKEQLLDYFRSQGYDIRRT
jgi:RNA polymerase sigma factor (sigma-70 family)